MLLYILPEASNIGNFIPDIEKEVPKTNKLVPHWIFQPLFNDIIIPTNSLYIFKRKCDFES